VWNGEAVTGAALIREKALIIVPASDAHLESKAETLDSGRPATRLAGTMTKAAYSYPDALNQPGFFENFFDQQPEQQLRFPT